jgi:ParB/RepB/Spo0J family partition protein
VPCDEEREVTTRMTSTGKAARIREIPLTDIEPNPHNPRRLFDEEPMRILRESIERLGVLVPVTVYEPSTKTRRKRGKKFVLLDGERRCRCCVSLGLKDIPAIVVEEPDDTQNILTMFHIHNLREGWLLMPTALKLRTLMKNLGTKNERELSELTKLSVSQIRRCKILLSYPKTFQNLMLAPQTERLQKADFFIELDRIRRPARLERFEPWVRRGDSKCVKILLDKYQAGVIGAVTEFRRIAEVYRAATEQDRLRQFTKELDSFLGDPGRTVEDTWGDVAAYASEAKEIRRSARRLYSQIDSIELDAIASDEETVQVLKDLVRLVRQKLADSLLSSVGEDTRSRD